jgi:hypothetical protein
MVFVIFIVKHLNVVNNMSILNIQRVKIYLFRRLIENKDILQHF